MLHNDKECVAMLLAGGQGTRLGVLTRDIAKPAVPFGGKYRIIDFPLSNCINSGIDTIGVLTQYQPFDLNQYIGNGQPWDLDRLNGGVFVLPPYVKGKTGEWYKGTANAIYQNIAFIDKFMPKYVLILSGDHIYKMNYGEMLAAHKEKNANCTIAVIDVPIQEASRFGIMNTDGNGRINSFEEKPKQPNSTHASMGIYIFTWDTLKKYLLQDEKNTKSSNDFGKNIIPSMLSAGERMFAYDFSGYWKDVGTISSLWEANMDLLNTRSGLVLDDDNWKIYARSTAEPPHFAGTHSIIKNSLVTEGCVVNGQVINSILSPSVTIGAGALIEDSIILPGASIQPGAKVNHAIVGQNAIIAEGAIIGAKQTAPVDGEWQITVVGPNAIVQPGTVLAVGAMVD